MSLRERLSKMNKNNLYPFIFEPVYKEAIWGGTQLKSKLQRSVPCGTIGESWEIYDCDGSSSKVVNGSLAGKTLRELIEIFGKELMGERFDGGHFPLIVKLIDAGEHLSLQVHPDEKACTEIGSGAEPKTEMWHILAAEKDANIIAGFKNDVDREKIFENLESGNIEEYLQTFNSQVGDTYLIPAGLVHSIGADNLILEIQQNSDTTYRIHDWNRRYNSGQTRQLHIEQARKSIRFNKPIIIKNTATTAIQLADTPYFQVEMLKNIGEYRDIISR